MHLEIKYFLCLALKSLSQRAQTETPAKTVTEKRDVQRLFLIGYPKSTEKLTLSPLREISCIMEKNLTKAELKMCLFSKILELKHLPAAPCPLA